MESGALSSRLFERERRKREEKKRKKKAIAAGKKRKEVCLSQSFPQIAYIFLPFAFPFPGKSGPAAVCK